MFGSFLSDYNVINNKINFSIDIFLKNKNYKDLFKKFFNFVINNYHVYLWIFHYTFY